MSGSVVLTPVDNFPAFSEADRYSRWTHGLYASDKIRSDEQVRESPIAFAGRRRITQDIAQIHAELALRLGGTNASLRLLSGLHAHIVLFMGLAPIGARVALLPVEGGGHFATPKILERLGLEVIPLPLDRNRMCLDVERAKALCGSTRPDILFIDRSEGLKFEDFSWVSEVDVDLKIFDSSQYIAQLLAGDYPSPFDWEFQLQVFTTHKSFPGPQKAAVVARTADVWGEVSAAVGTFVSSSHVENTYLAGFVLARERALHVYARRLTAVAATLEAALEKHGVHVVPRRAVGLPDWPGTQHIWIKMADQKAAFEAWRALESNRIQVNYRLLPYDLGWGLRLGVTAAVSRGLTESSAPDLGRILAGVLREPSNRRFRHQVTHLAREIAVDGPFEVHDGAR
jgi:glycine hydroxymethyltransferase